VIACGSLYKAICVQFVCILKLTNGKVAIMNLYNFVPIRGELWMAMVGQSVMLE